MKNYDTRDLETRLEELESDFQVWFQQLTDDDKKDIAACWDEPLDRMDEHHFKEEWIIATNDGEEYKNIQNLKNELGRLFKDGTELIHQGNFEDHARQLAEDIGAIDRNASWPCNFIDWERAADCLMMDYSSVDYDGETYYYRE